MSTSLSSVSSRGSRGGSRAAAAWYRQGGCSDARFDSGVEQCRLSGEYRVSSQVLEGHGPVKSDHQLQSGQRRAAEIEKVILSADLVLGDAEHLRPRGGQPVLGRRTWPLAGRFGGFEFRGERRQRLPIGLAIIRQRQTLPPMEGCRDHVGRERLAQPVAQRAGIQWPIARVEGHEMLAAIGSLGYDDRALANPGGA